MVDELTPEEIEMLEEATYDIYAYCERCYERKPCAVFRGKLLCKECIDKIRVADGLIAYV